MHTIDNIDALPEPDLLAAIDALFSAAVDAQDAATRRALWRERAVLIDETWRRLECHSALVAVVAGARRTS